MLALVNHSVTGTSSSSFLMDLERSMTHLSPPRLTKLINLLLMRFTACCIPLNTEWNKELLPKMSIFLKSISPPTQTTREIPNLSHPIEAIPTQPPNRIGPIQDNTQPTFQIIPLGYLVNLSLKPSTPINNITQNHLQVVQSLNVRSVVNQDILHLTAITALISIISPNFLSLVP